MNSIDLFQLLKGGGNDKLVLDSYWENDEEEQEDLIDQDDDDLNLEQLFTKFKFQYKNITEQKFIKFFESEFANDDNNFIKHTFAKKFLLNLLGGKINNAKNEWVKFISRISSAVEENQTAVIDSLLQDLDKMKLKNTIIFEKVIDFLSGDITKNDEDAAFPGINQEKRNKWKSSGNNEYKQTVIDLIDNLQLNLNNILNAILKGETVGKIPLYDKKKFLPAKDNDFANSTLLIWHMIKDVLVIYGKEGHSRLNKYERIFIKRNLWDMTVEHETLERGDSVIYKNKPYTIDSVEENKYILNNITQSETNEVIERKDLIYQSDRLLGIINNIIYYENSGEENELGKYKKEFNRYIVSLAKSRPYTSCLTNTSSNCGYNKEFNTKDNKIKKIRESNLEKLYILKYIHNFTTSPIEVFFKLTDMGCLKKKGKYISKKHLIKLSSDRKSVLFGFNPQDIENTTTVGKHEVFPYYFLWGPYTHTFGAADSAKYVNDTMISSVITNLLDNISCVYLTYGFSGTGKTFTTMSFLQSLFKHILDNYNDHFQKISITYSEITNPIVPKNELLCSGFNKDAKFLKNDPSILEETHVFISTKLEGVYPFVWWEDLINEQTFLDEEKGIDEDSLLVGEKLRLALNSPEWEAQYGVKPKCLWSLEKTKNRDLRGELKTVESIELEDMPEPKEAKFKKILNTFGYRASVPIFYGTKQNFESLNNDKYEVKVRLVPLRFMSIAHYKKWCSINSVDLSNKMYEPLNYKGETLHFGTLDKTDIIVDKNNEFKVEEKLGEYYYNKKDFLNEIGKEEYEEYENLNLNKKILTNLVINKKSEINKAKIEFLNEANKKQIEDPGNYKLYKFFEISHKINGLQNQTIESLNIDKGEIKLYILFEIELSNKQITKEENFKKIIKLPGAIDGNAFSIIEAKTELEEKQNSKILEIMNLHLNNLNNKVGTRELKDILPEYELPENKFVKKKIEEFKQNYHQTGGSDIVLNLNVNESDNIKDESNPNTENNTENEIEDNTNKDKTESNTVANTDTNTNTVTEFETKDELVEKYFERVGENTYPDVGLFMYDLNKYRRVHCIYDLAKGEFPKNKDFKYLESKKYKENTSKQTEMFTSEEEALKIFEKKDEGLKWHAYKVDNSNVDNLKLRCYCKYFQFCKKEVPVKTEQREIMLKSDDDDGKASIPEKIKHSLVTIDNYGYNFWTSNNPNSSRSHKIITFNFRNQQNKDCVMVITDLAGKEQNITKKTLESKWSDPKGRGNKVTWVDSYDEEKNKYINTYFSDLKQTGETSYDDRENGEWNFIEERWKNGEGENGDKKFLEEAYNKDRKKYNLKENVLHEYFNFANEFRKVKVKDTPMPFKYRKKGLVFTDEYEDIVQATGQWINANLGKLHGFLKNKDQVLRYQYSNQTEVEFDRDDILTPFLNQCVQVNKNKIDYKRGTKKYETEKNINIHKVRDETSELDVTIQSDVKLMEEFTFIKMDKYESKNEEDIEYVKRNTEKNKINTYEAKSLGFIDKDSDVGFDKPIFKTYESDLINKYVETVPDISRCRFVLLLTMALLENQLKKANKLGNLEVLATSELAVLNWAQVLIDLRNRNVNNICYMQSGNENNLGSKDYRILFGDNQLFPTNYMNPFDKKLPEYKFNERVERDDSKLRGMLVLPEYNKVFKNVNNKEKSEVWIKPDVKNEPGYYECELLSRNYKILKPQAYRRINEIQKKIVELQKQKGGNSNTQTADKSNNPVEELMSKIDEIENDKSNYKDVDLQYILDECSKKSGVCKSIIDRKFNKFGNEYNQRIRNLLNLLKKEENSGNQNNDSLIKNITNLINNYNVSAFCYSSNEINSPKFIFKKIEKPNSKSDKLENQLFEKIETSIKNEKNCINPKERKNEIRNFMDLNRKTMSRLKRSKAIRSKGFTQ